MPLNEQTISAAIDHLRQADPVMSGIIDQVGPFTMRPDRNRFGMLVRSIISQQISVGAARSIRIRLEQLVAPEKIAPETLLPFELEHLQSVGLSKQKATYVLDLANRVKDGTVQLKTIGRRTDEQIILELTQVKGIGRWTAQMFLIFALARPDVFPHDDLGVRMAIRDFYGLSDLPDKAQSHEIAKPWSPFASVASWYCWRGLEHARNGKSAAP